MADMELLQKMLRAVLQSNKNGVTLSRLQTEYKSLTGEFIPHKQMGFTSLDSFLNSMPSVVKMEHSRTGEVVCFAAVCKETAHIAQLVARQRNAKKAGRPLLVNCQMRVKPATPFILNAKPRTSLRQPDHMGHAGRGAALLSLGSRLGSSGDFRQVSMRDTQPGGRIGPAQNKAPATQMRKPPISSDKSDKKITLPMKFQKEVHVHLSRNLQQANAPSNINENVPPGKSRPLQSSGYNQQLVQNHLRDILNKYSNGFWVSKLPQLYRELYKQELPTEALKDLEQWSHVCMVEKPCSTNPAELLLYPAKDEPQSRHSSSPNSTPSPKPSPKPSPTMRKLSGSMCPGASRTPSPLPSPPSSPAALSPDVKVKLGELLAKYSSGLWANALPKLFQETYKVRFPEHILNDLSVLEDICTVDYPMPDNLKKAILYPLRDVDENQNRVVPESVPQRTQEVIRRPSAVPPLLIPKEEYPSVLVVEVASTDSVTLRFIGQDYSRAQEVLEDDLREFYRQDSTRKVLSSLAVGQLAAVKTEEEEEFLRAQVHEIMGDKVKVYYVDHGFSEVISTGKLLELHAKFFRLPFQATKCKLAGLEPFCQEPAVIKRFETMACGRILLAEILEREETPLVVLYDTSQDDDVNINAACMRALQDKSLENTLEVNSTHMQVSVTNVCSDGTIYCQLPSRGLAKLTEMLEKTEAYFHSQVTSEFLVSRPFCGKFCLARYKGKWSRVEITNLHGSRVLDIQFMDVGVPASVEVIELREVPPPFLRELLSIPPQAVKCSLAELPLEVGSWTPDAVLWLRDAVLGSTECSIKITKADEAKKVVQIYLFTSKDCHDTGRSVNRQVADSDLWKHQKDVFLGSRGPAKKPSSPVTLPGDGRASPLLRSNQPAPDLQLPPLLELPPLGQNIDIFVSVACHPGHFVLQPLKDQYKLVVLMGEMILYYNKTEARPISVEKNQIYAAKVENDWHRVLVKGILNNGLVSVYELDHGRHELVSCTKLQPLINEFRQLPFQAVTAQLAGVKPRPWSEEASIVFRNHVEKKALVAQIEVVHEAARPWEWKVVVYLVDTSQEERDIWVHDLMSEFPEELSKPA